MAIKIVGIDFALQKSVNPLKTVRTNGEVIKLRDSRTNIEKLYRIKERQVSQYSTEKSYNQLTFRDLKETDLLIPGAHNVSRMITETIRRSNNAASIYRIVNGKTDRTIYIILVKNTCLESTDFSVIDTGDEGKFGKRGYIIFKPSGLYGIKNARKVNKLIPGITRMPNEIVLFHELGHAAQWITKENWYNDERAKGVNASGYFAAIEEDNLVKNERPICRDLGYPVRESYMSLVDGSLTGIPHYSYDTGSVLD